MENRKIIATIEARIGSSRLPGKVLFPIAGKPVLQLMIERVCRSRYLKEVVIAMPDSRDNDPLAELAEKINVPYWRGSEDNVLSRVVGAARSRNADIIVQLTGDCPLMDPALIDECTEVYLDGGHDYVANELIRTYPIGFDVAVMSTDMLASTMDEGDLDEVDKEHVTTYIVERPEKYKLYNVKAPPKLDRSDLEITLDTREDFELIKRVFESNLESKPDFTAIDIIDFLDQHPEITKFNKDVKRKIKRP